jgi:hypothetical protein
MGTPLVAAAEAGPRLLTRERRIGPIQAALLHLGPDVLVFLDSVKLLRIRLEGA